MCGSPSVPSNPVTDVLFPKEPHVDVPDRGTNPETSPLDPGTPVGSEPRSPHDNPPGETTVTLPLDELFSNPETPAPPAEPTPDPAPTMIDVDPTETAAQKLKRLRSLRNGLMSTILTSPQGTSSAPPLVSAPGLYSPGTKSKLGS
jgi:hypothetical protein